MTAEQKRLELLLWGAFVTGVAIYPSALTVIVHQWRPPYDADLLARLQFDCMLGAGLQTLVAFAFYRRAQTVRGGDAGDQRALWYYSVAWALSEAIGLYGLLVGLWRAEPEVSTLFFTWAISLILLFRPPSVRRAATPDGPDQSMSVST